MTDEITTAITQAGLLAPLLALLCLAASALLGRGLGWRRLAESGGAMALCLGAAVAAEGRLTVLALIAWGWGLGLEAWGGGRSALLASVLPAIGAAWWLVGAPLGDAGMGQVLGPFGALALATGLALRLLRRAATPWTALTASLTLAAGLVAAGMPRPWPGLALVVAVTSCGGFSAGMGIAWRLPLATGLAGLAGAAALAFDALHPETAGHGGVSRVELAGLLCLPAIWLQPRLASRLMSPPGKKGTRTKNRNKLGIPAALPLAAALVVAAVAAGGVWLGGALGLR